MVPKISPTTNCTGNQSNNKLDWESCGQAATNTAAMTRLMDTGYKRLQELMEVHMGN